MDARDFDEVAQRYGYANWQEYADSFVPAAPAADLRPVADVNPMYSGHFFRDRTPPPDPPSTRALEARLTELEQDLARRPR